MEHVEIIYKKIDNEIFIKGISGVATRPEIQCEFGEEVRLKYSEVPPSFFRVGETLHVWGVDTYSEVKPGDIYSGDAFGKIVEIMLNASKRLRRIKKIAVAEERTIII